MIFILLLAIQVITESLPISSSGHVKLAESLHLKFFEKLNNYKTINKNIEYFFHGPTILILLIFFFKDFLNIFKNFPVNLNLILYFLSLVFITDLITLFFYFLLDFINNIKFKPKRGQYLYGFIITACLLFSLKFIVPVNCALTSGNNLLIHACNNLTYTHAIILGITQGITLLPGISRLGTTFGVACLSGICPQIAFYFSCAIQLPLITAGFLKGCYYMYKNPQAIDNLKPVKLSILTLIISSVLSFGALYLTYLSFLSGYSYIWGIYMVVPIIWAFIIKI